MPDESAYVQVAVDGTGKKVANVAVTQPQAVDASGNVQADLVRYQQQVTLIDEHGEFVTDQQAEVIFELKAIHEALNLILAALT